MIEKCRLVEPFSCKAADKIRDVAKKLDAFGQRHIYVIDDNELPVGLISVTDIINKIVIEAQDPRDTSAEDIMTQDIYVFDDKELVKEAYKKMTEKQIISVPITQHDKFIGILTLKEAVRYVTDPGNMG